MNNTKHTLKMTKILMNLGNSVWRNLFMSTEETLVKNIKHFFFFALNTVGI